MKKVNLIKFLILILAVSTSAVKTYADEVEQTITLSVSPLVTALKLDSTENASVNAENGNLDRSLQTVYEIITNGNDSDYDFTVTSTILDRDGTPVSAYGNNSILFGHTVNKPTLDAINNAKQGGSNNFNVIAYPVTSTITSGMESTYTESYKGGDDCFVIRTNNKTKATFSHNIGTTPTGGTYNPAQDESGQYQTTIILTVTPKG